MTARAGMDARVPLDTPRTIFIVLPAYDEAENLPRLLLGIRTAMAGAAAYHVIGKPQAAEPLIAQHPEAARGMGDLYARLHDWGAAIAAYRRVLADHPADPSLLTKLAMAYHVENWVGGMAQMKGVKML